VTALLGVAWSPAAAALPDLSALVDLVEVPGWSLLQLQPRPPRHLVLHNLDLDASLANPAYIDAAWGERARAALDATRSPWLSLHLGFASERVRFDGHMLPESPPLPRDALFERLVDSVRRARSALGADVPLLLENLDYCPEGAYEHVCEPTFMRDVLDATGCDLLLDLAHAQVSASWLGFEVEAMLEQLPLERVREIHLSSPRALDGNSPLLDDVHETLTERDYALLRWVLGRARPRAVVLEYRRDAVELRQQLSRLSLAIGRRRRSPAC
jgi:uncharacterized protein (UPF0276 family)